MLCNGKKTNNANHMSKTQTFTYKYEPTALTRTIMEDFARFKQSEGHIIGGMMLKSVDTDARAVYPTLSLVFERIDDEPQQGDT